MKNICSKYWIGSLALVAATAMGTKAFAQDAPPPPPPATLPQDAPPPPPPNGMPPSPEQADRMFVRKAAEGGMAEVKLGQLAAEKGSNPDVKAFGQHMVDDHTMLNEKMKPIADQMGLRTPDHLAPKEQMTYDRLSALSGDEFDKAYVRDMVMDHRMDLREFRREEAMTTNPDLKAKVADGEKVIAEHLRMVEHLAQEVGVVVPPPARRGDTPPPPPPPAQ